MNEQLVAGDLTLDPRVVQGTDGAFKVFLDGTEHQLENVVWRDGELRFDFGGKHYLFHAVVGAREVQATDGLALYRFQRREPGMAVEDEAGEGELTSQMPGKVLKLLCQPGQKVERGAPLLILEAMKMEHEICAPSAGVVAGYPCAEGGRVMPGDLLVNFEAEAAD